MAAKERKYHHGNLRAALLEASLKLVQEKGVRALTLREIGNMAGVSRMAAYRHFADKADILDSIREAGFTKFAEAVEAAKASAEPNFPARLDAMAIAYVRFSLEYQAYYEVMFGLPPGMPKTGSSGARAFAALEQTIREGQAEGAVRAGDSVELARAVWSLVHGISTLRLETDFSTDGAATRFILFCTGLMKSGLTPT